MSLNYGFNDKMESAKAAAQARRNKGLSERKTKWAKPQPNSDTPENRLQADLAWAHRELQDRDNTIAVLRAAGKVEPEPIDPWGSEFDRLSGKAERQGLPSLPPLSPSRTPIASEDTRGRTMTTDQYHKALKKLGLTPASKTTARALGVSVRQCQKYAAGSVDVPETVANLLKMYLQHGLLKEEAKP